MDTIRNNVVGVGLAGTVGIAGALSGYFYANRQHRQAKPMFHRVGIVDQLWIYPVKSCRPIAVKEAEFGPLGLSQDGVRDRVFLITDEKYKFITARQENRLVLIQPSYHGDELWLDAPDMETLKMKIPVEGPIPKVPCRIWGADSFGLDCGVEVATWIERFLKRNSNTIRFLYHPWETTVRVPPLDNWERFTAKDSSFFSDACPGLIMAKSSISDLNLRLEKKNVQVCARHFRPNILVEGTHPYDEDFWTHVKIGDDCTCRCVRPCTRCILTTINPETGVRGDEPLKTLKTYRQIMDPKHRKYEGEAPRLGQYLGPDKLGKVRIGDPVFVAY